jgi:hypothetical protein
MSGDEMPLDERDAERQHREVSLAIRCCMPNG